MGLISKIIDGWKNYTFQNKEVEKLAHDRASKCANCPHAVYGTYEKLMPDYSLKKVQGMKCSLCGCPLSTKLRSTAKDNKCDLNKW